MNNAEKFEEVFGIYATEMWAMPEADFLDWLSGEIGTDTSTYVYNMNGDMREVYHLTKQTLKEKVAVVYFKNNAKRYVPLYDFERKE